MLHTQKLAGFPIKRLMSTSRTVLEQLKERVLIRISGPEVSDYLQGLITNDMKHLSGGPGSMYTMFLNTQGRIMYDAVIYRPAEDDTYFIECDKTVQEKLQRHLKMYKVRRKLDIANLDSEYQVYVLFNIADAQISSKNDENASALAEANIVPCQSLSETLPHNYMKIHKSLTIYKDPRTALLGSRILSKSDPKDTETQVRDITGLSDTNSENTRNYRWLRYYLGIGEGTNDLPPGNSFPLECNCDYLHGVSFHKGCYIGQELTARVHHTGVVRKRLMPIYFTKVPTKLPDESIVQDGENLGKFRGMEQDVGLGLLRIAKVLKYKEIKIGNGIGVARKPQWWPLEAPKDISVNKSAI